MSYYCELVSEANLQISAKLWVNSVTLIKEFFLFVMLLEHKFL